MRELDQEIGAEEDEENFDPDVEVRDYDEVARSLPVFCISSRGYQKLQGRFQKDAYVPGFSTVEETEIPALQAHCKQLTISGRTAAYKTFLTKLSTLLNSIAIWCLSDGTSRTLTAEQADKEKRYLTKSLSNFQEGLDKLVGSTRTDLKDELSVHVFDNYQSAIDSGCHEAPKISEHWGAPVNRDNRPAGGFPWSSYKALCRRSGVFSNAQGPHDWNGQLTQPMMRFIAPGWERALVRRTPAVLHAFAKNAANLLRAFHKNVQARADAGGALLAGLVMVEHQLPHYEETFKHIALAAIEEVAKEQKEINRQFVPVICDAMQHAYDSCVRESGKSPSLRVSANQG